VTACEMGVSANGTGKHAKCLANGGGVIALFRTTLGAVKEKRRANVFGGTTIVPLQPRVIGGKRTAPSRFARTTEPHVK